MKIAESQIEQIKEQCKLNSVKSLFAFGSVVREDFKERDDENWMKHTLAWQDGEKVKIDYRNVHNFTLSNEVQYFPPKARVY